MNNNKLEKKALELARNNKPVHDIAFNILFDLALKEMQNAEEAKEE